MRLLVVFDLVEFLLCVVVEDHLLVFVVYLWSVGVSGADHHGCCVKGAPICSYAPAIAIPNHVLDPCIEMGFNPHLVGVCFQIGHHLFATGILSSSFWERDKWQVRFANRW